VGRCLSRAGSCRISAQRLSFGRKSLLALFHVILAWLTKDVLAFVPGPYRPRPTTRRSIWTYSKWWFVMEWLLHNHVVYEDRKFTVSDGDEKFVRMWVGRSWYTGYEESALCNRWIIGWLQIQTDDSSVEIILFLNSLSTILVQDCQNTLYYERRVLNSEFSFLMIHFSFIRIRLHIYTVYTCAIGKCKATKVPCTHSMMIQRGWTRIVRSQCCNGPGRETLI